MYSDINDKRIKQTCTPALTMIESNETDKYSGVNDDRIKRNRQVFRR